MYFLQRLSSRNLRKNVVSVAAIQLVYVMLYLGSQIDNIIGIIFSIAYIVLVPGYSLAKLSGLSTLVHKFGIGVLLSLAVVVVFGYIAGQTGNFAASTYSTVILVMAAICEMLYASGSDGKPAIQRFKAFVRELALEYKVITFASVVFLAFATFTMMFHSTLVTQDEFIQYGRAKSLSSTGNIPKYEPFLIPLTAISAPAGTFTFSGILISLNPLWDESSLHVLPAFLITVFILLIVESLPQLFSKITVLSMTSIRFLFPLLLLAPFFLARSSLFLGETFGMVMLAGIILTMTFRKYILTTVIIATTALFHDLWGIHVLLLSLLLLISSITNRKAGNWKHEAIVGVIFIVAWATSYFYYVSSTALFIPLDINDGFARESLPEVVALWQSSIGITYVILAFAGGVTLFFRKERRVLVAWFVIALIPFLIPPVSPEELSLRRYVPQLTIASSLLGFYFLSFLFDRFAKVDTRMIKNADVIAALVTAGLAIFYLATVIGNYSDQFNERYFLLEVILIILGSAIFILGRPHMTLRLIVAYSLLMIPLTISIATMSMLGTSETNWYEQIVTPEQLEELEQLKKVLAENEGLSSNFMLAAYIGTMTEHPVKTIPPFQFSADTVYRNIFNYTIYNELYTKNGGVDPLAEPLPNYEPGSNLYYITLQGGNIASDIGQVISSLDEDQRFKFVKTLGEGMYMYKVETDNLSFEEVGIKTLLEGADYAVYYSTRDDTEIPRYLPNVKVQQINGYSTMDVIEKIAHSYPERSEGSKKMIVIVPNRIEDFTLDPRFSHIYSRNSPLLQLTDNGIYKSLGNNSSWSANIYHDNILEGPIKASIPKALDDMRDTPTDDVTSGWIEMPLGSGDQLSYNLAIDNQEKIVGITVMEAQGNWIVAQKWLDQRSKPANIFDYDGMDMAIRVNEETDVAIGFVDYKGVYWQAYVQKVDRGWNDISFRFDKLSMPRDFNPSYVSKLDVSIENKDQNNIFSIARMQLLRSESTEARLTFNVPRLNDQFARLAYALPSDSEISRVGLWVKSSESATGFLGLTYSDNTFDKIPISMGKSWKEAAISVRDGAVPKELFVIPDSSNISITIDGPYGE